MIDYYYKLQALEVELSNIEQEIKDLTIERNQIIHDIIEVKDILFDTRLGS